MEQSEWSAGKGSLAGRSASLTGDWDSALGARGPETVDRLRGTWESEIFHIFGVLRHYMGQTNRSGLKWNLLRGCVLQV